MDVAREDKRRGRWARRGIGIVVAAGMLAAATYYVVNLKRAAPVVDANTVWTATVSRGEMLRQVRGNGTLVPAEVWWIPAPAEGRVERILLDPGETVDEGTVLVELSNPVLERDQLDAQWELDAAEATLRSLETELTNTRLDREEALAIVQGERKVAKLQAQRDQLMFDQGLLAQNVLDVSKADLEVLETRARLLKERLDMMDESRESQLATQRARVAQFQALVELRQKQLGDLKVKAGITGVLQQVMVEVGQQVTPADTLAKVAKVDTLEAELGIQETLARDVQVGQPVNVDTRNGKAMGRVSRVDPAVVNGNVKIEVQFEEELPRGARPDLSVEGTVELERLQDVLYVSRPVGARPDATVTVFHINPATGIAIRVPVQFGRASVNEIEILEGLSAGDEIIVSDMSRWDDVDRLKLR